MKIYTIYKVIKYQTNKGEEKEDLQIVKQTENREIAAKWMDTQKNHIARYITNNIDKLIISNKGYCCFVDIMD